MLAAFEAAVTKAQKENTPTEQLAAEVEDPSFGEAVRKAGANNATKVVGILILLAAIKSCSVDVKLDANRLIEQLTNSPPVVVVSHNQGKK